MIRRTETAFLAALLDVEQLRHHDAQKALNSRGFVVRSATKLCCKQFYCIIECHVIVYIGGLFHERGRQIVETSDNTSGYLDMDMSEQCRTPQGRCPRSHWCACGGDASDIDISAENHPRTNSLKNVLSVLALMH